MRSYLDLALTISLATTMGCTGPDGQASERQVRNQKPEDAKPDPGRVPSKDLKVSWVNPLVGDGESTLIYTAPDTWATGCTGDKNALAIQLLRKDGKVEFRVNFFVQGECPTGQTNYCSSLGANGLRLIAGASTSTPFSMTFTETTLSCPVVTGLGYTSFTVSDPSSDTAKPPQPGTVKKK